MNFKEKWNACDEKCPSCGTTTKRVRGFTKQNLKRLVVPKWSVDEALITFMLIMILVLAYAYMNETKASRDWLNDMTKGGYDGCQMTCLNKCELLRGINSSATTEGSGFTVPKLPIPEINQTINDLEE